MPEPLPPDRRFPPPDPPLRRRLEADAPEREPRPIPIGDPPAPPKLEADVPIGTSTSPPVPEPTPATSAPPVWDPSVVPPGACETTHALEYLFVHGLGRDPFPDGSARPTAGAEALAWSTRVEAEIVRQSAVRIGPGPEWGEVLRHIQALIVEREDARAVVSTLSRRESTGEPTTHELGADRDRRIAEAVCRFSVPRYGRDALRFVTAGAQQLVDGHDAECRRLFGELVVWGQSYRAGKFGLDVEGLLEKARTSFRRIQTVHAALRGRRKSLEVLTASALPDALRPVLSDARGVAVGLRESARLGGRYATSPELVDLRRQLDGVTEQLVRLGEHEDGLVAADLRRRRDDLEAQCSAARGQAAAAESSSLDAAVALAVAGDVGAIERIIDAAAATPGAFAPRFAEDLYAAIAEALVVSGAETWRGIWFALVGHDLAVDPPAVPTGSHRPVHRHSAPTARPAASAAARAGRL